MNKLKPLQVDVSTAYLHVKLDDEVYMEAIPGYQNTKSRKAIFSQKSAVSFFLSFVQYCISNIYTVIVIVGIIVYTYTKVHHL